MAKHVLGRNLEALLDDSAKAARKEETFPPEKAPVGSGVRSLMRGHQADPGAASTRKAGVPRWYLFGGDILLTALALVILCTSPHPLTWRKELFCAAAVILGACLAMGAVLLKDDK